jgi:hypothetical protein
LVDGDPCAQNQTGVRSTLVGVPQDLQYPSGGGFFGYQGCMELGLGKDGVFELFGSGFANDGKISSAGGWLRFPNDGISTTDWLCSSEPNDVTVNGLSKSTDAGTQTDFSWAAVHRTPACPGGTPVEGHITVSLEGLSGTIEGENISSGFSTSSTTDAAPDETLFTFDDCSLVGLGTSQAFLLLGPRNGHGSTLYCLGASTTSSDGTTQLSLSRVGACDELPPAVGDLSVCAW